MVDGLFFCATLTGRRGDHTSFVQTGAETSNTVAEAVKPDPGCSQKAHSRWVPMSAEPALPLGELGGCLGRRVKGGAKNTIVWFRK